VMAVDELGHAEDKGVLVAPKSLQQNQTSRRLGLLMRILSL